MWFIIETLTLSEYSIFAESQETRYHNVFSMPFTLDRWPSPAAFLITWFPDTSLTHVYFGVSEQMRFYLRSPTPTVTVTPCWRSNNTFDNTRIIFVWFIFCAGILNFVHFSFVFELRQIVLFVFRDFMTMDFRQHLSSSFCQATYSWLLYSAMMRQVQY